MSRLEPRRSSLPPEHRPAPIPLSSDQPARSEQLRICDYRLTKTKILAMLGRFIRTVAAAVGTLPRAQRQARSCRNARTLLPSGSATHTACERDIVMGRLSDKVVFVTGAARGQGRSHAVRLAEEGADIVAVDLCARVSTAPYEPAAPEDLDETVSLVEGLGRKILARHVDVRDLSALDSVVEEAVSTFGGIDTVVANAGIASFGPSWELSEQQWQDVIDINLTGIWKTTKAVIPSMLRCNRGGSIILTSSVAGLVAYANLSHYTAAKHGVTGLSRALSVELAPHNIRVNSVHSTTVNTDMLMNPAIYSLFFPHLEAPTQDDVAQGFAAMNGLNVPWVEPVDVSNAVLYLASDEARYVTGTTHVVDAGGSAPYRIPHS